MDIFFDSQIISGVKNIHVSFYIVLDKNTQYYIIDFTTITSDKQNDFIMRRA